MSSATKAAQVRLDRVTPSHCQVVFDNPPLNLMGPEFVLQIREIVTELENDDRVKVVVFESAVDGFFLNHSDFVAKFEDLTGIPQGPTGLEAWPDVLVRLTRAPFVSIALIRAALAVRRGTEVRHSSRLRPRGQVMNRSDIAIHLRQAQKLDAHRVPVHIAHHLMPTFVVTGGWHVARRAHKLLSRMNASGALRSHARHGRRVTRPCIRATPKATNPREYAATPVGRALRELQADQRDRHQADRERDETSPMAPHAGMQRGPASEQQPDGRQHRPGGEDATDELCSGVVDRLVAGRYRGEVSGDDELSTVPVISGRRRPG